MYKTITATIILFFIIFSVTAYAGDFNRYCILQNYYDDSTDIYYNGIYEYETTGIISKSDKTDTGTINNYLIYNTKDKSSRYLFSKNSEHISLILFETGFDKTKNSIVFNVKDKSQDENSDIDFIINNINITSRVPKNKILIITEDRDENIESIWVCDKTGNSLTKICLLNAGDGWHLDLKNNKIRVITQKGNNSYIKEYEW